MKKILAPVVLTLGIAAVHAQDAHTLRPHVRRQGKNLVANPSIKTMTHWTPLRDAEFDAATSRLDDGSGSILLKTPIPNGSAVNADLIPVRAGQQYTYGFYFKTLNGPTLVGAQISLHDAKKTYLRNLASARGAATHDGAWQEFALPFVVPPGIEYIGLQAYKTDNTQPGGKVWVDDFYLGKGLGLEQPPSPKRGFDGSHVRVDPLGNFEIKKNDTWTPFFPLSMYSDNTRDWSIYSRQGWNTIMWTGAAHQVKQAKEAVSDFNPDGMMAGFSIAQYTFPSGWAYNDLKDLSAKLREIDDQHLDDHLLLYYWDNEINHDQWRVPVDVIRTIQKHDTDASGKRRHPVYALQGTYNIARVHASKGLVDVSGTYFGGTAADSGGAGQGGSDAMFVLDRQGQQTTPAAFAQFNGVDGPGDMRLRLYHAVILGAKAIGYWCDAFNPGMRKEFPSVGPVDQKAWWPDFPSLRREVDRLLPLIREPHWTAWAVTADASDRVHIGTRNHRGLCHLLLVNQTDKPQKITITLNQLPYAATEARDYFDDQRVASIQNNQLTLTLPAIGIGSGTKVLRLTRAAGDR